MKEGALLFADGRRFDGYLLGKTGRPAEVVFTTGMTGYEEVLTDPSSADQIVTLTYPLIGNSGITHTVRQGERTFIAGAVVSELARTASNWESKGSLTDFFRARRIPCLCGVDTRAVTRAIRNAGAVKGIIAAADDVAMAKEKLTADLPRNLVARVTTPVAYKMGEGMVRVAVIDCGTKKSMLDALVDAGCHLMVLPAFTPAEGILAMEPDAVWISNGPGDPQDAMEVADTLRELIGKIPLFGVGMGHQLLALALGAKTYALPFGHRGANHPVIETETGHIAMTSQNHGYAVADEDLPADIIVTARSLHDNSIEGFRHRELPLRAVQFHPEGHPGPTDYRHLFGKWLATLKGGRA